MQSGIARTRAPLPLKGAAFAFAAVLLLASTPTLPAQPAAPPKPERIPLEAIEVQPDLYLIAGAGANIVADIGSDGVVLVDTGTADRAEEVLALIRHLTSKPIRYLINTSAELDHVGGNAVLSLAGLPIVPAGYKRDGFSGRDFSPILAEQHVQDRMASGTDPTSSLPMAAWPTSTYSIESGESQRKLFLNGQGIQLLYQKAAHSDGDSLVHFRRSDVLVTGDIFDATRFPVVDPKKGGSVQGIIDSLNNMLDIAISPTPFPYQEGGTLIVPGHGRICMTTDLVEYRDMVTIIRDRVQAGITKGQTLAQVEQSNPALGYRRRYGSDTGPWTTHMFIEAIYNELKSAPGGGQ
jgi:cyclase